MINPNHFLKCTACGAEFVSFFAGAVIARGCSEPCPTCGNINHTPLIAGDDNFAHIQRATEQPMIREFGKDGRDGYVFMGRGYLTFSIRAPGLVPILAAYDRNISRAIDLLEIFYEVRTDRSQVMLSTIYISTMTAYECLTDDLLGLLVATGNATFPNPNRRPSLRERRDLLFDVIGFTPDAHVNALRYLYAFRNCLTHNAGVVDQKFIDNLSTIEPASSISSHYAIGQPLVLDPSTATSFADSLQQLAHAIFPATQQVVEGAAP